jgi:YHS domain-containing protein
MQVTDPVCGMQIDSAKAEATEVVEGQTYYFCSSACHGKFQANPAQYAKQQDAKPDAPHHRC